MSFEIQHTAIIDRPVNEVFGYVSNPENDAEWSGVIVEAPSMEGEMEVGATWSVEVTNPVGTEELEYECTKYDPPSRYALRTVTGFLNDRIHSAEDFHVISEGDSTRLEIKASFTVRGFLRVARPILARMIRSDAEDSFERLESSLQNESADAQ